MEFTIVKDVRSAFMRTSDQLMSTNDYDEWVMGGGSELEKHRPSKEDTNPYVQNFSGWTIGESEYNEKKFPVMARIEEGVVVGEFVSVKVFVYGEFSENDWEAVQHWFFDKTGARLGPIKLRTQTVYCDIGVTVDLIQTAENMGHPSFDPKDPYLHFGMDSELMDKENPSSRIHLFQSGKVLFGVISGDVRNEIVRNELIKLTEKIKQIVIQG